MSRYKQMSLEEVVKATNNKIVDKLVNDGVDIDYPENWTVAILRVLDKAEEFAASNDITGFAIASTILMEVIAGLRVQLPEELNDRLHGRIG